MASHYIASFDAVFTRQGVPHVQVWRLAWSMITYREILQETSWQTDTNFMNGIRQLRWIAQYLKKARIKNPNNTQEFVIQVRRRCALEAISGDQPGIATALC